MTGLLVVNGFLRTGKFNELYDAFSKSACQRGVTLHMRTNAELSPIVYGAPEAVGAYDFVLFWDKDIYLAKRLEQLGYRVYNSASSILKCDDKALTYLALADSGIPMPKTILAPKTFPNIGYQSADFAKAAGRTLGYPLVLKECFGSFGQQVYLIRNESELTDKVLALGATPMLFQQLVSESYGRDVRVNVVGGEVVAAMLRTGREGDFRSNISAGGSMQGYEPTGEERALAVRAASLLGLSFAGVDILFGKDGPVLCEVNSNAHFVSTLKATGVNMADRIMDFLVSEARA